MNRAGSPMTALSANTIHSNRNSLKTKGAAAAPAAAPAPVARERSESPLLPDVTMSPAVKALIKENAQMLTIIPTLQSELDKTQSLLKCAEAAKAELQQEVTELHNELKLASVDVTSGSGAVSNLRQQCAAQLEQIDTLRAENERLNKLMGSHELLLQDRPTKTARTTTYADPTQQAMSESLTSVLVKTLPRTVKSMQSMYEGVQARPQDRAAARKYLDSLGDMKKQVDQIEARLTEKDTSSYVDEKAKTEVAAFKNAVVQILLMSYQLLESDLRKKSA